MTDLTDLPNIGPKLAAALVDAGITTPEALHELGSVEAWWRVHPTFDCLHSLLALEGAIRGIPKSLLDEETRARLHIEARDLSRGHARPWRTGPGDLTQ